MLLTKRIPPNTRELVRAIDTHIETVDLEVTSNLNAAEDAHKSNNLLLISQPRMPQNGKPRM